MKKTLKILFITFILFISFMTLNTVVKAEDPIVAYGVCTYNITTGADEVRDKYKSGSSISFYFTEASFKKDSTTEYLFVKDNTYDDYYTSVGGLGVAKGSGLLENNKNAKLGEAHNSFKTEFEANGGSCPEVFVMKKNDKNAYIPYFDSNTTDFCDTENQNCIVVANYSNDNGTIKVYPSEKSWTHTFSGEGACVGAQATLYFTPLGKLKADISYQKSSSFYENSAQKIVTVDVEFGTKNCGSQETTCQLKYLRDFVTTGTIIDGIIRLDEGNEKFHFNANGVSGNTCDWEEKSNNFSSSYNCTTFDSISATIESKMQAISTAGKKIKDATNKYLDFKMFPDRYVPKTNYTSETNVDTITAAADEINAALNDDALEKAMTDYQDYMEDLLSNGTLCTEDIEKVDSAVNLSKATNNDYQQKIEGLTETLQALQTRSSALGNEEAADVINSYISNANKLSQTIKSVQARASSILSLSADEFGLGSLTGATCGIISTNLKDFLQTIIDYVRIIGIVLAVILGVTDYIKAIFGTDEQSMKKANKNLTTRLIVVALLFLVPVILEFVLSLFNVLGTGQAGTCGIK